jgi:transcriptional regulator with XRE-family HTH domain
MENIIMRFCRENKKYTAKFVAGKLGITVKEYKELEKGVSLLTRKQAKQLGAIYEADSSWFYNEAVQLDLLLTRMAIIKVLKWEKDLLIAQLEKKRYAVL